MTCSNVNLVNKSDAKEYYISEFQKYFSGIPRIFRAPGRINLIGEHTDYNDGFVLPMLLDKYTTIAITSRDDYQLHIWSENMNDFISFSLEDLKKKNNWSDYIAGVAKVLIEENFLFTGANVCVKSDIPVGAGLSSSAGIEVAVALGFLSLSDDEMSKTDIALMCQRAENEFIGTQTGIMDQFVAIHGKKDNALLLDCRSLEFDHIFFQNNEYQIVICNTKIKHELSASAYNSRNAECAEGVNLLRGVYPDVRALRDISMAQLDSFENTLPEVVRRRCNHVVSENERVLKSVEALKENNFPLFGELMNTSHDSLRDDYEVSCHELDTMVNIARNLPGVYGARMTGGGFGGCTVNLVKTKYIDSFTEEINNRYHQATGIKPEIYISKPARGAYELI